MKNMPLVLVFLLALVGICAPAPAAMMPPALDTTIRILIVKDSGASQVDINNQVAFLMDAWTNPIGAQTDSPITITIINPGNAILMPMISNDGSVLHAEIKTYIETIVPTFTKSAREITAADLVIAFTDNDLVVSLFLDACGSTIQGNWLGTLALFTPNAQGVDKDGADDWYISIVESLCTAGVGTMAHEIGHLLGGQHTFGGSAPLLPDGRGDYFTLSIPPYINYSGRTVMAVAGVCGNGFQCSRYQTFSSAATFGTPGRRMVNTLTKTAESVANYVQALPPGGSFPPFIILPACSDGLDNDGDSFVDSDDPDCDDPSDESETPPPPTTPPPTGCYPPNYIPYNVEVHLVELCLQGSSATGYLMTWQHACPGGTYQVIGNSGGGDYVVLGTPVRSALIGSQGNGNTVKVRACRYFSCSAPSFPPIPVPDIC